MSDQRNNRLDADIDVLSQYVDNELDADTRTQLEARLADDGGLRAQLSTFERNDSLIRQVLSSGPASRIPASAMVALSDSANVAALPVRRRLLPMAAAASLLLGVGAVVLQLQPDNSSSRAPAMDALLADALETAPSRADGWDTLADGSQLRAVLTFPAADGKWCREFLLASDAKHWRGVACRDSDTWVTQVMGSEVFLQQATQYRAAGADDSEAVAQFIDETAVDVALGPDEESALIASGWQQHP